MQFVTCVGLIFWTSSSVQSNTACGAFRVPTPTWQHGMHFFNPSMPLYKRAPSTSSRRVMMSSSSTVSKSSKLKASDLLPNMHNNATAHEHDAGYDTKGAIHYASKEDDTHVATKKSSKSDRNDSRRTKPKKTCGVNQKISTAQSLLAPPLLLPWSIWVHARNELRGNGNRESSDKPNIKLHRKNKRRWEIPLTSKPFEKFEFLRSTVTYCFGAIAIYFVLGVFVFPMWLEPGWSFIDSLYFSMTTLTTVGYGDLVPDHRGGLLGKLFLLFFNIYAVCISVSALGIIAKVALTQEKKLITRAKEQARSQLIKIFELEDEEDEEENEDELDDDEECGWIDNILEDRCSSNDEPVSIPSVLLHAIRSHSFNFLMLILIAFILGRVEKWPLVDLLYYWNSTATTIGFGDVAPKTQLGRMIAVIFIPLSVITLGEVIASIFAFITSRASARAEKDFLRREITLSDLEYLDIDDDGKVNEMDFVTFMLVAMQKVDKKTMTDLKKVFHALDVGKDGYIQKEDLITLRQRKRVAKRLRREARKSKEKWYMI